MKKREEHLTRALAVYYCQQAAKRKYYPREIDLTPMRELLKAYGDSAEAIYIQAKIIRDNPKRWEEHLTHALAVYCCQEAIRKQRFIADVDLSPMRKVLQAQDVKQACNLQRAQEILKDMGQW